MENSSYKIHANSTWTHDEIIAFLENYNAPLRLSGIAKTGYPLICSLWYEYSLGKIWCATKKHSKIVHVLQNNPKCAFELAPNEPPYYGVRGNGLASMHEDGAAELLERLIKRYLGSTDSKIAQKLLQQSEHEIAIMIEPGSITSWDYRQRMSD